MHIVAVVNKPTTCQECGRAIRKYAVLSDARTVGMDCASTLVGAPSLTVLDYITRTLVSSTPVWVAKKAQKQSNGLVIAAKGESVLVWRQGNLIAILKKD